MSSTKKTPTYTQCELIKVDNLTFRVGWIPTAFARKGRILDLKNEKGRWTRGWRVNKVMSTEPAVYIEAHESDHRHQREASDI